MKAAAVLLAGLTLSLVLCPVVRGFLIAHELLDHPNERSSHESATPRGGGYAVAAAMALALAPFLSEFDLAASLVVAGLLATIGAIDDRRGISATSRLVAQLICGAAVSVALAQAADLQLLHVAILAAAVFFVAFVNAFNFMDGINGISVAHCCGVGASYIALSLWQDTGEAWCQPVRIGSAAMIGASLGFLPFNAPRALLFLGDVGSYFLGAWIASMALLIMFGGVPITTALAPLSIYLSDTGWTLVARARRGAPLLEAHREHAYQRLVGRFSHASVAIAVFVLTFACGTAANVLTDEQSGFFQIAPAIVPLIVSVAYLCSPTYLSVKT